MTRTFLFFSGLLLKPNANSPHTLYRDRLSKTFLFSPQTQADPNSDKTVQTLSLNKVLLQDPDPLGALPFAKLNPKYGPVHLINTALNIQGSRYANKRGRKADFFFFSSAWSGSRATGYVKTPELVKVEPSVNIETAMAVSGAAASSNMGIRTVFGIAPTLALLNVRLGYWMTNPRSLRGVKDKMRWRDSRMLYLPAEMFGLLDETSPNVYLTDGGHIENLGVYELLRRRCRVIIAIDAEADPYMNFRSFVEVQRFARIDLGVRIDLPWDKIREQARALNGIFDRDDMTAARAHGPAAHVAVGTIDYGAGARGVLVYVKACMTGDENDYIMNYKSRNATFPHESTSDQFFSEEQFEVYRSLGNHALRQALNGQAHVEGMNAMPGFVAPPPGTTHDDLVAARKTAFDQLLA